FSSGTADAVVPVESTLLLPALFIVVAALFVSIAQPMGRELAATRPPLRAYVINLLGSLAGVAAFALVSWLELPPAFWFGLAAAAALPLMTRQTTASAIVGAVLLVASVSMVYGIQEGSLWSPYYRITVFQDRDDTVV